MSGDLSVKVFGVGGGGGHTLAELSKYEGAGKLDLLAVNTDAMVLLSLDVPKKILIGKEITGGTSTGSDPILGGRCARYDIGKISEAMDDADVVFITCGLGGGTGSGAAPVVAERAKTVGALTVAIVTIPFNSEGKKTTHNAEIGFKNLKTNCDAVIVIPNERLLTIAPGLPITEAFKLADETTATIISELSDLLHEDKSSFTLADIRAILTSGRTVYVGIGSSEISSEAADLALESPLINADFTECCDALVKISYGVGVEEAKVEAALNRVSERLPSRVSLIWGSSLNPSLQNNLIKIMVVVCLK